VRPDSAFRKELLRESVECFALGDAETGEAVLRDYMNAAVGFAELAEVTQHSAKSLMRMLSPSGNPQVRNLFEMVEYLQRKQKVHSLRLLPVFDAAWRRLARAWVDRWTKFLTD
jgi:DNA-binding phage protein